MVRTGFLSPFPILCSQLPDAGESEDDFVLVFSVDGGEDLD